MQNLRTLIWKLFTLLVCPFAIFAAPLFVSTDQDVGEISNALFGDVPIIPANYAFSIWGVIYLGVFALAVMQLLPRWADHPRIAAARLPLVLNMAANFFWLITWLNQLFALNTLVLAIQMATGVWLYLTLRGAGDDPPLPRALTAPFSLYAAWLMLATVLGVTSLLAHLGFDGLGFSPSAWTVLMLFISSGLGIFFLLRWSDSFYAGVFVWALIAIAVKPEQQVSVIVTALVLAALFIAFIVIAALRRPSVTSSSALS